MNTRRPVAGSGCGTPSRHRRLLTYDPSARARLQGPGGFQLR
jgi:hypothetical protein